MTENQIRREERERIIRSIETIQRPDQSVSWRAGYRQGRFDGVVITVAVYSTALGFRYVGLAFGWWG